jgi:DNA-directed RNA polymerase subunit RPC12/RpoP
MEGAPQVRPPVLRCPVCGLRDRLVGAVTVSGRLSADGTLKVEDHLRATLSEDTPVVCTHCGKAAPLDSFRAPAHPVKPDIPCKS